MTERSARDGEEKRDASLTLKLRDAAAGLFVATIKTVVLYAPRALFRPFVATLAFLHRNSSRREVVILRSNLEQVLGLAPGSTAMRAMRKSISLYQAASVLETVRGIHRPDSIEVSGLDELRRAVTGMEREGRGQILITAHLGSWELLGRCMAEVSDTRFHSLAKRSPVEPFTRFLEDLRHRAGTGVLWIGRKSLLREMLKTLKKGEWLGFAMDQKPEGGRGPVVQFFGRQTEFVIGPASLAIRTGCPVLAAFCIREGPFRYRVWCRQVLPVDHGESDEQALTQRLADEIERAIRKHPDQWPWSYRRWRFDPVPAQESS